MLQVCVCHVMQISVGTRSLSAADKVTMAGLLEDRQGDTSEQQNNIFLQGHCRGIKCQSSRRVISHRRRSVLLKKKSSSPVVICDAICQRQARTKAKAASFFSILFLLVCFIMPSCFDICCGEGEEERKFGPFVVSSKYNGVSFSIMRKRILTKRRDSL